MSRYILKRLLMMIPVVIGVIVLVFTIMYLTPGDPAEIMLGESATPEQLAAKRAELGTDQPYLVQLGNYIKKLVLHGDLGTSYTTGQSVTSEIVAKFPTTFKLAFMSVVVAVIIGVTAGVIFGHKAVFHLRPCGARRGPLRRLDALLLAGPDEHYRLFGQPGLVPLLGL